MLYNSVGSYEIGSSKILWIVWAICITDAI